MIKVFIADEQIIVREGIKYVLKDYPDIKITGEAASGLDVVIKIKNEEYDVIIVEVTMPGKSGLDILKEIKRRHPKLPVIMFSMQPENQLGIRMLQAGASGYLMKNCTPIELVMAIRKVFSGGKYISPALAEHLAFHFERDPEKAPHERLSDREFQIMKMLSVGKTVTEIASELSLSVKTVSTHRTHIVDKMKLDTNAEIASYAKAFNLLP